MTYVQMQYIHGAPFRALQSAEASTQQDFTAIYFIQVSVCLLEKIAQLLLQLLFQWFMQRNFSFDFNVVGIEE